MDDRFRFRAWDREKKVMVYLDIGTEKSVAVSRLHVALLSDYLREQWGVVMQSTGLKDKNGKLIYEGDIISYGYYEDDDGNDDLSRPMLFPVKWSQDDCGFVANGRLIPHNGETLGGTMYPREVIGNIYENPELIGE